jgi:hypothetical protein
MGEQLKLDYYYGNEPDRYCFYRIPKVLFTKVYFEELSTDAKVLYGLMLDMMASSRSNRWVDKENRVFIQFSIQRAMAYLNCGKDKAIKLFAELDTEKGIGLIERIDRGQGKADLIYVKSFEIPDDAEDNARIKKMKTKQQEKTFGPLVQKSDAHKHVDNLLEVEEKTELNGKTEWSPYEKVVGKIDQSEKPTTSRLQKVVEKTDRSDYPNSRSLKSRPLEVGFSDPNNTNYNNSNYKDLLPVMSSHADKETERSWEHTDYSRPLRLTAAQSGQDGQELKAAYTEILRNQVRYEELMYEKPYCFEMDKINGIINMVADLATTEPPDGIEWINSRPYSHEVVKSRLLKTDYEIITHVLDRMNENTTKIRNMRNYLLTALYNARDELDISISSQVNYDMYGGWEQKGIRRGEL